MIFWIFAILTVLGIVITVSTGIISEKYRGGSDNKFMKFVYHGREAIATTSVIISVIAGTVAAIMLIFIIIIQTSADGYRESSEQRHNALIYKSQTESIRDEFGIVNKEYIDEVQSWNEDVAKYQAYSDSFWIGIFYPDREYDGFETINLEDIRMRD